MNRSPRLHSSAPPRLVLLGKSGFIGKALQETAKAKRLELVALGRPAVDLTAETSVEAVVSQLSGSDHVLMLSALTPEHGPVEDLYTMNMRMMKHATAALEQAGFAHLVYLSSDAVYPWTAEDVTEDTLIAPGDAYGRMHAEREKMATALGQKLGRSVSVLRPCAVHGPGDTHHSYGPNRFLKSAVEKGEIVLFGEGEELRPHLWIDDCVDWILEASLTKFDGLLDIVPRDAVSFRELAEIISRLSDRLVEVRFQPRQQAITHRKFSPTKRELLWPHLPATQLSDSLRILAATVAQTPLNHTMEITFLKQQHLVVV